MKQEYFLFTAALILGTSNAEEPKASVIKEAVELSQADKSEGKPDAFFRVKFAPSEPQLQDLKIPTFSHGMRTRIVDIRVSADRAEVAVQLDEFEINYMDYKFNDGKWSLQQKKQVCTLSGSLALKLAQVDILGDGLVEVSYRDGYSVGRPSSWVDELLTKQNQGKEGLMKERYKLQGGQFVLTGDPVRLRPTVAANTQKSEEQNNAQHPTDGAAEPEKPKE